nr:zinc finger, CCHC-type [Tanacetum cinerariifolium]
MCVFSRKHGAKPSHVTPKVASKVADFACNLTDYKEVCKDTMTPLADKASVRDVFKTAIRATKVAVDVAGESMSLVAAKVHDMNSSQRLDECKELMEYASDELGESSRIVGDQIKTDLGILDKQPELMNLLSAVVDYQETCLDGCEKPELRARVEDLLLNRIALAAIIYRQLPFEYTTSRSTDVVVMARPVQNINHSAFRSMFEREKLSGNNFNDWFRQLKLVLRVEKKMFITEQPIPPAPAADSIANVLAEWNALYDAHNEVACLMLGSMTPNFIDNLKIIHLMRYFRSLDPCLRNKLEWRDQLERLGYVLPQDLTVGLILNGLTKDFTGFVRNYNMHNMRKTIGELHAMLIEYEKGLPKKAKTPQDKQVYIPKPKNPKPVKVHPAKDDTCHQCMKVGHWKRNCPVYLAELLKKKQVGIANSLSIFTIELFAFPNKSWLVYGTVVDVFIPLKKSKVGKRFAFVRFVKVHNLVRLVENLCTIWIGRHHLFANQVRYERPQKNHSNPSVIRKDPIRPL